MATWGKLSARVIGEGGQRTPLDLPLLSETLKSGSTVLLSTSLFSTKNDKQTCTRTVTSTPGVSTCVVHAVADLVDYHIKEHGHLPPANQPVFQLEDGSALTRSTVSAILKAGAAFAQLPADRLGTHSLRRGGCSMYIAAGCSHASVMRFGRWCSQSSFERYVFPAAEQLMEGQQAAHTNVPYFEMS